MLADLTNRFSSEVLSSLRGECTDQPTLDRLSEVVDNPNFQGIFRLPEGLGGPKELFCLAAVSWNWSPRLGILVRLWIESRITRWSPEWQLRLRLACFSRVTAEETLLSLVSHPRAWFGNWSRLLRQVVQHLRALSPSRKVRRALRKRGYNDHGSAKSADRWLPKHASEFTELQNEIERERQLQEDSYQLLVGFLM